MRIAMQLDVAPNDRPGRSRRVRVIMVMMVMIMIAVSMGVSVRMCVRPVSMLAAREFVQSRSQRHRSDIGEEDEFGR